MDLAKPGHEVCISSGIEITTNNGNKYQSQELYFRDIGLHRWSSPLHRVFHYNCQVRLIDEKGKEKIFRGNHTMNQDHVISGAIFIKVEMPPAGSHSKPLKKRIIGI